MIPGFGRLGYISRVAKIPQIAKTVEEAYFARAALKAEYRSILRGAINLLDRDPSLATILEKAEANGAEYAIARAGVTNIRWNIGVIASSVVQIGLMDDDE